MKIEIEQHLLYIDKILVNQRKSPHKRGELVAKYLVMHCSEGTSFEGTVGWLTDSNSDSKASAHLVIGKELEIAQLLPFNVIANHAGRSNWQGITDMSKFSIGIELDNPGYLAKLKEPTAGRAYKKANRTYEESAVVKARHQKGTEILGWHRYPRKQLDLALEISRVLIKHYKLVDFLGHDEISAKYDPGPAFPIRSFRKALFSRNDPL